MTSLNSTTAATPRSMSGESGISTQKSGNDDGIDIASLFQEEQPEWEICGLKLKKKTGVESVGKFIFFCGMIGYIGYQLYKYFDNDINRIEYVKLEKVDETPLAYIYMDYYDGSGKCTPQFFKGTDWFPASNYSEWESYWGGESIDSAFDYIDTYYFEDSTYITRYFWGYTQLLFIPSASETISVSSKESFGFRLECNDGDVSNGFYWSASGNREELRQYFSLDEALNVSFFEAAIGETGYRISLAYDWYASSYHSNFKSEEFYDYFDMSIDATYPWNDAYSYSGNTENDTITMLSYSPNENGIKTILRVVPLIDLLDIFGLAGGMYSSMQEILAYFSVALIWGFSVGCCSIKGVASETGPDGLLRQQLEAFVQARDETIVELTHRITDTEEELMELRRQLATMNGRNQNEIDKRASLRPRLSSNNRVQLIYQQTKSPPKQPIAANENDVPSLE